MFKFILSAVTLMGLLLCESAEACTYGVADLSPQVIRPKDSRLPLNGKIFSSVDIELIGDDGKRLGTSKGPLFGTLSEYAASSGFEPGQKVWVHAKVADEKFAVLITSDTDTQAPAVPSLTIGTVSYEIKISGDGLFYIIEDESGPLTATSSNYLGWGTPKKYRAIAVDEAGNRSAPSEWIIASGELKSNCPVTTMPGSFGCSSTGGEAAFGALIAYAFLRLRRKRVFKKTYNREAVCRK